MSKNPNGSQVRLAVELRHECQADLPSGVGSQLSSTTTSRLERRTCRPRLPPSGRRLRDNSCCFAIVISKYPAESFATADRTAALSSIIIGVDQSVAQRLMVTLSMIMHEELVDGPPQRFPAEEDHPLKTFSLYREHESLAICVQIGRTWRQAHDVRPGLREKPAKLLGVLAIPIDDQVPLVEKKTVDHVGQVFRAICSMNALSGFGVIPATCTRRVDSSMKNRMYVVERQMQRF